MYLTKFNPKIEISIKYVVQNMDPVSPGLPHMDQGGQGPEKP